MANYVCMCVLLMLKLGEILGVTASPYRSLLHLLHRVFLKHSSSHEHFQKVQGCAIIIPEIGKVMNPWPCVNSHFDDLLQYFDVPKCLGLVIVI